MLRVAICDSDVEYRKQTEKIIFYIMFDVEDVQFTFYESGAELIKDIQENSFQQDLLVIDLILKEGNGLRILEQLRKWGLETEVIVQTEAIELALYGYRFHVFDFIRKPVELQEAERVFTRYISEKIWGGVETLS